MYPHCTASLLFLSNTNIFQPLSPHSTTPIPTFIVHNSAKICILHLLFKSSCCFLCAAGRQSWEERGTCISCIRRTEREFSVLSFLSKITPGRNAGAPAFKLQRNPVQLRLNNSLQGLSFTFVLNADLTNAEKIFTRLITSTSLAETLYSNTSQLFTKQHHRSLDYFFSNLS